MEESKTVMPDDDQFTESERKMAAAIRMRQSLDEMGPRGGLQNALDQQVAAPMAGAMKMPSQEVRMHKVLNGVVVTAGSAVYGVRTDDMATVLPAIMDGKVPVDYGAGSQQLESIGLVGTKTGMPPTAAIARAVAMLHRLDNCWLLVTREGTWLAGVDAQAEPVKELEKLFRRI